MQWIQRSALAAVLIVFVLLEATAAQRSGLQSAAESLIIGKTIVRLGASKDSIVPVLMLQYVVKPMFPNCTLDSAVCRAYNIFERDNSSVGFLEFDVRGNLVKASVELLPGFQLHSEGEIGRAIVSAIATLVSEGQNCSLGTSSSESVDPKDPTRLIPEMLNRQAIIECGRKRIRILSLKLKGQADSMQMSEEIGCSSEVIGGCQR